MTKAANLDTFKQAFINAGRTEQFSDKGLEMLYNYVKPQNELCELGVHKLCILYDEYTSIEAYNADRETYHTAWDDVGSVAAIVDKSGTAICHY